ncbi:MAG TPA: excinuclease ABC subunit C [Terracidiphilus sp.]|nr:excinuclease ABC subunit C [Terracidiphilus sp.]
MPEQMQSLAFSPDYPRAALSQLPAQPAVFALYSADALAQPYLGRTPNLRGRLERLLQPSPKHPRRLQLAGLVRRIDFRLTGSEFESLLVQFELLEGVYGAKSLERMHLRAPAFVRFLGSNRYPRLVVTHRPSRRESNWAYGPFASRAAAERYIDEALKLFLLRRCTEELDPDPSHPGCIYSEMKMCLAPCYKGCTDERYAEEAAAVEQFLASRGESRLVALRAQRDKASGGLEYETAAAIHAQVQRVEAVRALAPELVRPLSRLRAVILQAAARPGEVTVFLFDHGQLCGPAAFSTTGMRIQNEQSGSSSLFAHPVAVEPIPESEPATRPIPATDGATPARPVSGVLEARMEATLSGLEARRTSPSPALRQGHLALLKRWYYRPEVRRAGEIFFPDDEGRWPLKALLRAAGRVAATALAASKQN